jgi:hypothetical protein
MNGERLLHHFERKSEAPDAIWYFRLREFLSFTVLWGDTEAAEMRLFAFLTGTYNICLDIP